MPQSEATIDENETGEEAVIDVRPKDDPWFPAGWIGDWFGHWPFANRIAPALVPKLADLEMARVEQYSDGDDLVIRAEMPGIENDDDIDVSITGDQLTVKAKREQRKETEEDGTFRTEFHYGSFRRTVTIPPGVDPDAVTADYRDGIVEVRVPAGAVSEGTKRIAVARK